MESPAARALALAEAAAFDFAVGDEPAALAKLAEAVAADPACFEAWLAKAEVHFAARQLDEALIAGERAAELRPKDIHVHTSLSRIWMERGDKTKAEHHGAKPGSSVGATSSSSLRASSPGRLVKQGRARG